MFNARSTASRIGLMFLLLTFIFSGVNALRANRSWISVRDREFVGKDPEVAAELARRMRSAVSRRAEPPTRVSNQHLLDSFNPEPLETRRHASYSKDEPGDDNLYYITMKMQEQAIYSTQYRFKEVAYILRKYGTDPRFYLSYIFSKLDEWKRDINVYYAYAKKQRDTSKFQIYKHIYYYTHCLRRDVDVSYSIDYLLVLHNRLAAFTQQLIDDITPPGFNFTGT